MTFTQKRQPAFLTLTLLHATDTRTAFEMYSLWGGPWMQWFNLRVLHVFATTAVQQEPCALDSDCVT